MAIKSSNKLTPILAAAAVVVVVALFVKSSDDKKAAQQPTTVVPNVPDGDTTADTLRTLTAEVKLLREENRTLSATQAETNLKIENLPKVQPKKDTGLLSALQSQVDTLTQQVSTQTAPPSQDYNFDLEGMAPAQAIWIEDVSLTASPDGDISTDTVMANLNGLNTADIVGDSASALDTGIGQTVSAPYQDTDEKEPDVPVYTVPKNSTFIGSTGMTAMLGRVPINGSVQDPYPIKIIVGKENLAANGLDLPEVSHMIFTGTAVGDWTLSCVRGDLTSVTYVFQDGTIRTLNAGDEKLSKGNSGSTNRIAWISDERGIPCVSGRRISNASSYLIGKIFAKGVEAGAAAVAKAEQTSVVSAQGDTQTSVTGDVMKNTAFNTLSGGTEAISEYLNKREQQSFDVIYVDTGAKVAIHVDAELPIDYEQNGRKLRHDQYSEVSHNITLD